MPNSLEWGMEDKGAESPWVKTYEAFVRGGEVVVRIGAIIAVAFGLFWALKLALNVVGGDVPPLPKAIEQIVYSVLSFVGAVLSSTLVDRYVKDGKFRLGGLVALIVGAVLIIPALIAGVFLIVGGVLLYAGAEVFAASEMKLPEKPC